MADVIKVRRGATATITNAYIALGSGATYSDFVDLKDGKTDANDNTSVIAVGNSANGLDVTDNKNTTSGGATISTSVGTSGGADNSVFTWTGYSF
jgi:hypothetical protein